MTLVRKINLSFVQYGGMSYRSLIDMAVSIDKSRFNVTYFWCHPGKDLFSNFKHIQASEADVTRESKRLSDGGVKAIEFSVTERFIPDPSLPWIGTDFFKIFNSVDSDIIFTWKGGRSEYPFMHLNVPVVEWNIFGIT